MRDEDRIRLKHMIEACEAAIDFITGHTREDLDRDRMLFFAVVRAVEIIGEAASKISEGTRAVHDDIQWSAIAGMRNRLVHAYFDIDANIVWVAATEEIPALLSRLQVLVEKE